MPAYNFQAQFVEMIPERKWHTVRPRRKRQTKVGDVLWLYTGMRTKSCKLIAELPCVKVEPIQILPLRNVIVLEGQAVTWRWNQFFAYHDGFDTTEAFFRFFRRYPKRVLENELEVIYWR